MVHPLRTASLEVSVPPDSTWRAEKDEKNVEPARHFFLVQKPIIITIMRTLKEGCKQIYITYIHKTNHRKHTRRTKHSFRCKTGAPI
jgi:hypothetical protein